MDELAELYRDRIVFHRDATAAWNEVVRCRLAVLDVSRPSAGHLDALAALARDERPAPPILMQGFDGQADGPGVGAFKSQGWAVVELPGFDQIRLVLPGGQRSLDGSTINAILGELPVGVADDAHEQMRDDAAEKLEELATRVRELERRVAEVDAERELAERRRDASEEIVATLRRVVDSSRTEGAAARAHSARLGRAQAAVRKDLIRLQRSQAWRLGHWLSRTARLLTFRKPGHTDAVSKAIDRIDAAAPPRHGHR